MENEVNPTSMHSMPLNDDMLPSIDADTIGNLTPFNNMKGSFDNLKGSYNNLFCDNLDDDPVQTLKQQHQIDLVTVQSGGPIQRLENVYCNISPATQQTNRETMMVKHSSIGNPTNHIVDNLLAGSDPSLHVYSNVSQSTAAAVAAASCNNETEPIVTITTSSASKSMNGIPASSTLPMKCKSIHGNDNSHSLNLNNIESIISQSMLNQSSKLLSDNLNDLDLDDPTLVSGSIVNTPAPPNTSTMSKVLKSNDTTAMPSSAPSKFSSSKKTKQSANVDDSRSNISKKLFNDTATSSMMDTSAMADSENGNGSFLRSLHDTTMIDTALDLDSIDDTNIGIQNVS